ncbi:fructokinase [Evansella vedderi]|uniref:fructokinase n=1 Tax=Evansella vedderi TaxID=38282 RepID=A0ABT9ZXA1_9BACI|nr:ROK family protein [Evansella vedderi]MDQ0255871.1 fructokinase [Evansella vedderi]
MFYGAVEAGGTKFVCAVGDQEGKIIDKITLPTEEPQTTLSTIYSFFDNYHLTAIGIGSFGPIELNKDKENYGEILNTPKLSWKNFNIYEAFAKRYKVPTFISTDVNTAALGEYRWGSAKNANSCLYITVGTGIGAGFVNMGEVLNAWNHPEMGHIHVPRHKNDTFEGSCPYHKDCLEGLASGSSIEARYKRKGKELGHEKEVWELEGYYLAQAIMSYSLILGPEKIILGGGVMKQQTLYPIIREQLAKLLNDYITIEKMEEYIVPPSLNDNQGIMGALALAIHGYAIKSSEGPVNT